MIGDSPDKEHIDPHGECAAEIDRLRALLRDVYWPLANVRRFDPDDDERYPHAHPHLLEKNPRHA